MNTVKAQEAQKAYLVHSLFRVLLMSELARRAIEHFNHDIDAHGKLNHKLSNASKDLLDLKCALLDSCQARNPELTAELRKTTKLESDKVNDIDTVIQFMLKIGNGRLGENYDEFLNLLVDCFDKVFYAESHHKKLQFNKYRALFKLISEEILHDTNQTEGKVLYQKRTGDLYFRTIHLEKQHNISHAGKQSQ